jgi:hypothetical protein
MNTVEKKVWREVADCARWANIEEMVSCVEGFNPEGWG